MEESKEKGVDLRVQSTEHIQISDSAKVTISIIGDLSKRADEAFKSGHHLESSIIMFQLVEFFLRLVINIWAKQKRSSEDILEKVESEQSFFKLVIFLGLVKPDNGISQKLFGFNAARNKIVHGLFYKFESVESLKDALVDFHKVSLELIENIGSLIPKKISEMI
jgi:hypothetical protein